MLLAQRAARLRGPLCLGRVLGAAGPAAGSQGHAPPRVPGRVRGVAAAALANEVELSLAGGAKLEKGGGIWNQINEELSRLRKDNDEIIEKVAELKKARAAHIAVEAQLIEQMQGGEAVRSHDVDFTETLRKIEEVDQQVAGLRCQQLHNSRDISNLKRGRVRIEKSEEVVALLQQVDAALMGDESTSELQERVSGLVSRLMDEFEDKSHEVQLTKKDIDGAIGKLRNLALALRVRRGRIDAEVDELRGKLVSSFFEAQRKNAKLTRLRDMQALNGKEIALLERVLDKMQRRERVRLLIEEGDQAKLASEAKAIWGEIVATQKAIGELERFRDAQATEGADMVAALRAPDLVSSVSAASGKLREQLIAALREEELAANRLAVLRGVQELHIRLLADLKKVAAK